MRLVECEPKAPKDNRSGEQLDQAVPTESKKSSAVGTPGRPERKCRLQRHPQNCEYLKSENSAGDIGQRSWAYNGHLIVPCGDSGARRATIANDSHRQAIGARHPC